MAAADTQLPDHRIDDDAASNHSKASSYSSLTQSIFGDIDEKRENRFRERRKEFQSWLKDFALQYDATKLTLVDETDLEAQNRANEIDMYRTNIIHSISQWAIEIRQDFSWCQPGECPIFQRLLSWIKTAQRLTNKRPQFNGSEDMIIKATWPTDNFIFPPEKALTAPLKRRVQQGEDINPSPPTSKQTTNSRHDSTPPKDAVHKDASLPPPLNINQAGALTGPCVSLFPMTSKRARVKDIREMIDKGASTDAKRAGLSTVYNDMLSQRERMDVSEEARNAQDAMSLAGTAGASSSTLDPTIRP